MAAGFGPPWQPYCGAEFHGKVAGHPLVCDRDLHKDNLHRNSETGVAWWGFRTPGAAP